MAQRSAYVLDSERIKAEQGIAIEDGRRTYWRKFFQGDFHEDPTTAEMQLLSGVDGALRLACVGCWGTQAIYLNVAAPDVLPALAAGDPLLLAQAILRTADVSDGGRPMSAEDSADVAILRDAIVKNATAAAGFAGEEVAFAAFQESEVPPGDSEAKVAAAAPPNYLAWGLGALAGALGITCVVLAVRGADTETGA